MEDVGIFCGHLDHFTTIWYFGGQFLQILYILKLFGVLFAFWYVVPRNSGNRAPKPLLSAAIFLMSRISGQRPLFGWDKSTRLLQLMDTFLASHFPI
jgi:hypothetical protein